MKIIVLLVLLLASGCSSLLPIESQRSRSVQATENLAVEQERTIRRVLEVTPMAAMPQAAKGVHHQATPATESLTITTKTATGAGSKSDIKDDETISIPFGVKIVILAIGLLMLAGVLGFIWRSIKTTSIGQGIALGDEVLAAAIRRKRQSVTASTDQGEIARAALEIAELEAERGRLRSRA